MSEYFFEISNNSLFVILQFHDEWFHVFALARPLLDALFGIWVEILFLLILKRLISKSSMLLINEVFLCLDILLIGLLLQIVGQLNSSLSFFLFLLLLSDGQLFISHFPELSKFFFLGMLVLFLLMKLSDLVLSTSFNCLGHLDSSSFLFFEKLSCFVFSFSDLLVQDFFFLISDLHELSNLTINELLLDGLLLSESLFFFGLLKMIKCILLSFDFQDSSLLFFFFDGNLSLNLKEIFISFLEIFSCLCGSL